MSSGELPISQWPNELTDFPADWNDFRAPAGDDVAGNVTRQASFANWQRISAGHVATVVALRALNAATIPAGTVLVIRGHTLPGIGAGSFRLVNDGSIGANQDNNGTIVHAAGGPPVTDPGAWYWLRVVSGGYVTPEDFGAIPDGTDSPRGGTEATTAFQAALDNGTYNVLANGSYLIDGIQLTRQFSVLRGAGNLYLKDSATLTNGNGIVGVFADDCTVAGVTIKGNLNFPAVGEQACPLLVINSRANIDGVKAYDARHTGVVQQQNNIWIDGDDCVVRNCQSYNAGYSLYNNRGRGNRFLDNYGRRQAPGQVADSITQKGYSTGGGANKEGGDTLLHGFDLDDILQCDWTEVNGSNIEQSITVTSCNIKASNNAAMKASNVRYLQVADCTLQAGGGNFPGISLAEQVVEGDFVNCTIIGSGSGSHVQHFDAAGGRKHVTSNRLRFHQCKIGGTDLNPTGTSNTPLVGVIGRAFEFTLTDCNIHRFRGGAIANFASQQGINDILSVPPARTGSGNVYLIGAGATGDWAGLENQLAYDFSGASTWLYEEPWFDMRVYNEATPGWLQYIDGTIGWIALSDDFFKLDVHGNTFFGIQDGVPLTEFRNDGFSSTDLAFLKWTDSRRVRWYDNALVNAGAGGTAKTTSIQWDRTFQQKGPGIWYGDGTVPTDPTNDGQWDVGDRIERTNPAVGSPDALVCIGAGKPGTWAQTPNLLATP